jgi:hypothetical protein
MHYSSCFFLHEAFLGREKYAEVGLSLERKHTVVKILFNSIISTKRARFMTVDIKNFYLMTPLKRWEYTKLRQGEIPQEIVKEYNLDQKATKYGSIYVEIRKGMYDLPQAGLLAQE